MDVVERGVQCEVVTELLTVRLILLKVVNRGSNCLTLVFSRTDGMHRVTDHLQSLEWHHYFIILGEVADQHQNSLCRHGILQGVGSRFSASVIIDLKEF